MMANNVLVVAEDKTGALKKISFEMLGVAQDIASKLGGKVEAALIGSGVTGLAESLGQYGATKVYVTDDAKFVTYSPDGYAQAIATIAQKAEPAVILMAATTRGRDLSPRVAAKLHSGLASDCIGFDVGSDGRLLITRPIYAGKAIAQVRIKSNPQMATVRPNVFPVPAADVSKKAAVEAVPVTVEPKAVVKETLMEAGAKLDVAEANIIVTGGRGMKTPENFAILEDLAKVLGGAVGASRAAVDAGWRPHSDQVGQTGKTVSPTLYIACGLSGSIQHMAGMRTSKVIVAINKDSEAPIFKIADYGIVGDLFDVVPLLTEEFKKVLKD
jgi:electron transfer flavoprotein alpha subunit